MKFRYEWRILDKGLLIEPEGAGPYYERMYFGGYDSEEAAYADWQKIVSAHPFWTEHEMVLIKIFTRPDY